LAVWSGGPLTPEGNARVWRPYRKRLVAFELAEVRRMNCNSSWHRGKQRSAAENSPEHKFQYLLITSLNLIRSLCLLSRYL